ncbi:hypothetical protein J2Y03_005062 [Neobacillus niacini]|nr:hypothetical protein [Neobacillus niacini]
MLEAFLIFYAPFLFVILSIAVSFLLAAKDQDIK